MRLKIGEYEIPERCLTFLTLYHRSASVLFAGVLVGEKGLQAITGIRRLAETRAIPFEAVDRDGVSSTGLCDIRNLKLEEDSAAVKFSGRLVRPFTT